MEFGDFEMGGKKDDEYLTKILWGCWYNVEGGGRVEKGRSFWECTLQMEDDEEEEEEEEEKSAGVVIVGK